MFFISFLIVSPISWYMAIKVTGCSFLEFSKPIIISLINTGIMVFVLIVIKQGMIGQIYFPQFILLIFSGMTVYLLVAYFIGRVINYNVYKLIKQRLIVLR